MFHNWFEIQIIAKDRESELLRRAEHERRVRELRHRSPKAGREGKRRPIFSRLFLGLRGGTQI